MQITIAIARNNIVVVRDINPNCNCESFDPIAMVISVVVEDTLEVPGEDIESIVVVGGNIVVAAAVVIVAS